MPCPPSTLSPGNILVVTSTTRPVGADLFPGRYIYEVDTFRTLFYDGTGWVIIDEPTQSYTPAVTQNGARTSTVTRAVYSRSNGWVRGSLAITITQVGSAGSRIAISSPITPFYVNDHVVGSFIYFPTVGSRSAGSVALNNGLAGFLLQKDAQTDTLGVAPSYATANGDIVELCFEYQMTTRYS